MRNILLPFLVVNAFQIPLISAWIYRFLRQSDGNNRLNQLGGFHVHENPKSCDSIPDQSTNPVTGIQVYQYFDRGIGEEWGRSVKYLGFWNNGNCRGMPRYIMRFYEPRDGDIEETVLFDGVNRISGNWESPDERSKTLQSWAEISDVDILWQDKVPRGAVATLTPLAAEFGKWTDSYMILENMIRVVERPKNAGGMMGAEVVPWEGSGTGPRREPKVIQLNILSNAVVRGGGSPTQVSDDDVQVLSKKQYQENVTGRFNPIMPPLEAEMRRGMSASGEQIRKLQQRPPSNPNLGQQRKQGPQQEEQKQDEGSVQRQAEERRQQQHQQDLDLQQALYRSLQDQMRQINSKQLIQQTMDDFANEFMKRLAKEYSDYQNQAASRPEGYFASPEFQKQEMQNLRQLRDYWVSLGFSERLLIHLLSKLPPLYFHELFEFVMKGELSIEDVASYVMHFLNVDLQQMTQELGILQMYQNQQALAQQQLNQQAYGGATNGMTNFPNMGMNMNINPFMNMNANQGGSQPLFGDTGTSQQIFGGQASQQPGPYQNQLGERGPRRQLPPVPRFDSTSNANTRIEEEDPFTQLLQSNEQLDNIRQVRPSQFGASNTEYKLEAPPSTPFDDGDLKAEFNDYQPYLRMPALLEQLPGMQQGDPSDFGQAEEDPRQRGGSTLAQMIAGMNQYQNQENTRIEEETNDVVTKLEEQ